MTVVGNNYWRINYRPINMEYTRNIYNRAQADKTMLCALPVILVVGLLEFAVKNTTFILANCVIAAINGTSYLVHQIRLLCYRYFPRFVPQPAVVVYSPGPVVTPALGAWGGPARYRPVINLNPPLTNQQFAPEELSAFRAALKLSTDNNRTEHIQIDNVIYAIWHNPATNTINIQDTVNNYAGNESNLISVAIDEPGRITSIQIDGVNHQQIPTALVERFRFSFRKSLEISSRYQQQQPIRIQLIRRGLKDIPGYHLEQLTKVISASPNAGICVKFMKNDLTLDEGADAGGLSRDYFDDLFENLTKVEAGRPLTYWKNQERNTLMPSAADEALMALPDLTFDENKMFREMGQVMMYCYQSFSRLLIGKRFDKALFEAAFSLTDVELATPFANLSHEAKLKMCERIAQANEEPAASIRLITLAKKGDKISNHELNELEEFLNISGKLPPEFDQNQKDKKKQIVLETMRDLIYDRNGVGRTLAAIHAIAGGMKQMLVRISPLQVFQNIVPQEFDTKIQGSLDRSYIANQLQVSPDHFFTQRATIEMKLGWIKEWVQHEATEDDLRNFVKYVGGASCLPADKKINVKEQSRYNLLPAPAAHSCFYELDISPEPAQYGSHNDYTKENFIKALKELALTDPTAYTMA